MKAFHTVAIPHKDILEGKFTIDVYAANLWEVYHERGPADYRLPDEFFNKTHLTREMGNLLDVVEKRLKGKGGDPVIQLQTPFGGGKTHSLIALYHKAKTWKVKPVVIVGEELNSGDKLEKFETPWGLLEKQLAGEINEFSGHVPPGGDQLRKLLEKKAPVIILMDEMITYLNRCDTVNVSKKSFCSLVIDFIQTLCNVVSSIEQVSFVLTTTPSNPNDRTQRGVEIVSQLQNAIGRRDVPRTPVEDSEIAPIIRTRLFSSIDERNAKAVVDAFMDYAEKNSILPVDSEPSEYKKQFLASYPFMPEVIDILYHRWGSFPNFQRTRGVLRLLALVVNSVKEKNIPYISLADFDLKVNEIRLELLKHIGNQYESIVSQDITGLDSRAALIDKKLPQAFRGLRIGTRTANTVFLYSFSGGDAKGITLGETKRVATTLDNAAALVSDVWEDLRTTLFFIKSINDKYLFTTQPNIFQILSVKMDNIRPQRIEELKEEIFRKHIANNKLKTYYLPTNSNDILDSSEFKLVIMNERSESVMRDLLKKKGTTPRVNRNTVFFHVPMESEKLRFENLLKKYIAHKEILKDSKTLNLSIDQIADLNAEIKKIEGQFKDSLRTFYRTVYLPDKNYTLKEVDLGVPTLGNTQKIDDEIYGKLRLNGDILEKMAPIVIREKFLKGKEYVEMKGVYKASLSVQGETRYADEDVITDCVREGVVNGIFGLGELKDDVLICKYYKELIPSLDYGDPMIIDAEICKKQKQAQVSTDEQDKPRPLGETGGPDIQEPMVPETPEQTNNTLSEIRLDIKLPMGKASSLLGMINFIQKQFRNLKISITATEGEMDKQDYEDKIKETLRQIGGNNTT